MLSDNARDVISPSQADSLEGPDQSSLSVTLSVEVHWQSGSQPTDVTAAHREPEPISTPAERRPSAPSPGDSQPGKVAPDLSFIAFRRQELHNRRVILMKTLQIQSRGKEPGEDRPEFDGNQELKAIQAELEELVIQEEEVFQMAGDFGPKYNSEPAPWKEASPYGGVYTLPHGRPEGNHSPASVCQEASKPQGSVNDHTRPYGGVYVLPPPQAKPGEIQSDPDFPSPPSAPEEILEVEALGRSQATVQCPSCENVITTETYSKAGGAAWTLCLMATMFGCVAGCCLIPFLVPSLKDTYHRCPQCKAQVHIAERI